MEYKNNTAKNQTRILLKITIPVYKFDEFEL